MVVFLSIGWILFYINAVTRNSSAVLSPPLIPFSGLSAVRSYCCWFSSGGTISSPTSVGTLSGHARSSANAVALSRSQNPSATKSPTWATPNLSRCLDYVIKPEEESVTTEVNVIRTGPRS